MPQARYGISEWFGQPFRQLTPLSRSALALSALQEQEPPLCPFQNPEARCSKKGGVCSIQRYESSPDGRVASSVGHPVIVCPRRFEESRTLVRWLADIVGLDPTDTYFAREVPFMRGARTQKPAGKIDLVVAGPEAPTFRWFGLEIQAVYFSGAGMSEEFERLRDDLHPAPPFPNAIRRPDWRSSSAKRLMPQLEIKVPTLRRWASKLAVAVDRPFFDSVGGPSAIPTRDLDDGDIVWLVPELQSGPDGHMQLSPGHWEVLTLEQSRSKLLAAETIARSDFEASLKQKLRPLE